jgi:hypothetical protein
MLSRGEGVLGGGRGPVPGRSATEGGLCSVQICCLESCLGEGTAGLSNPPLELCDNLSSCVWGPIRTSRKTCPLQPANKLLLVLNDPSMILALKFSS